MPNQRKPTLRRRLSLVVVSTIAALILGEVGLRLAGVEPGAVRAFSNVTYVDELRVEDRYLTDDEGIFKANPAFPWSPDIEINSDGFRSPPFTPNESGETSILFLGDSFTWGATAIPLAECFVDRIRDAGFVCHNTGIPGADPRQYAAVAEKWSPRLRPNIVVAMVCMANDMKEQHPPGTSGRLWWVTNAGWLLGYDGDGRYFESAQDAYDYYVARKGQRRAGPLRSLLTSTAMGTCALAVTEGDDEWSKPIDRAVLGRCLERMRRAAEQVGARFELVLIPARPGYRNTPQFSIEQNRDLLAGFEPHIASELDDSHYMPRPNEHLNAAGHGVLAAFLIQALGLR